MVVVDVKRQAMGSSLLQLVSVSVTVLEYKTNAWLVDDTPEKPLFEPMVIVVAF